MNLNGILTGSEDPQGLVAYYTRLFGEPGWAGGDFRGRQLGTGSVTVGPHDQVRGRNPQRGRLIWNLETPDVHVLGSGRQLQPDVAPGASLRSGAVWAGGEAGGA
jgi:hypothetical protein